MPPYDPARHAQKSAKPHASAAHRRAGQLISRKPRQKPRYRNRAFQPRQRHAGALMRAGGKGEMPVRRAADVEIFRIGELSGITVGGADAQGDKRAGRHLHAADLDRFRGDAVAELVGAFVAQEFLDCGFDQRWIVDQPVFLHGISRQRDQSVADQIGRGLMPGVEQKDAVVQQLLRGQPFAIVFALNKLCQHVAFGIAGFCPPPLDQRFEIGQEIPHRIVAACKHLGPDHRLQRAKNRQRPVAQRLALVPRYIEQVADHLNRNRGGKILDQFHIPLGGEPIEQPLHQRDQVRLHLRDGARRQRAHDQPPHPRMRRRIVEYEAGGVVLVQQRVAVFRREFASLVGGEKFCAFVDADQVVVAGQKIAAVRQTLDRRMLPQCTIGRVGIGIELRRQFFDVEIFRQISRARIHAAILFRSDRYAVFAVSHATNPATVPLRNTASLT